MNGDTSVLLTPREGSERISVVFKDMCFGYDTK
jgi:hypothetical protein